MRVWTIYIALMALAVPAVLVVHLHAGLVAGVLIAGVALVQLLFDDRVCLDCGRQWRGEGR